MRKIILSLLTIASLCFVSCHKHGIGEFVFIDGQNILHLDKNCKNISVIRKAKPISVYTLKELDRDDWQYICPECVSNQQYAEIEIAMIGCDNLKTLYNTLCADNYDMQPYRQFRHDILDSVKLHRLYSNLIKDGYLLPSLEQFKRDLGLLPELPAQQSVSYGYTNLRKVYNTLLSNGYTPPEYSMFALDMTDEKNLKAVYATLQKEGYTPPPFTQFKRDMGLPDSTTASPASKFDEQDRKWLYQRMKKAGVNTGTYEEFLRSLLNSEDFDWYYQKSLSLGLNVGSKDEFRKMMVDDNLFYEWLDEINEYDEYVNEMRYNASYDSDLDDYHFDNHH